LIEITAQIPDQAGWKSVFGYGLVSPLSVGQSRDNAASMIEPVHHPTFSPKDFDAKNKRPGLSAIMRLRNEQEFAALALGSIIPFFDEIVIVFNGCTDKTPDIVADFAAKYPDQIRAFHYLPKIHPFMTREHSREPAHSVHSGVYYTNFALSKVTCEICCCWDGDEVADPVALGRITKAIRDEPRNRKDLWLSPHRYGYWWYVGVNLWERDGEIFVHQHRPLAGLKHDHGFWHMSRYTIYKRHVRYEYLFKRLMRHKYVGCAYYHLKGLKSQRGTDYYGRGPDSGSEKISRVQQRWLNSPLITLDELRRIEPRARELSIPQSLGIIPHGQEREALSTAT
jgi:glycosyltransferase involved in cell wall biosynthesis